MEVASNQQIEEELRRALNLNHDQPALNARRSKGSSHVSTAISLPGGDVSFIGSPRIASSPRNASSSSSPAGAAEKIPAASFSSPSVNNNNSKQASSVGEAGGSKRRNGSNRRKPRQWQQSSPRYVPHDAVGVTGSAGNGKNVSVSQKSALAAKPGSPRVNTLGTTTTMFEETSVLSAVSTGVPVFTSGSCPGTVSGMSSGNNATATARTVTKPRGGKASRGRGVSAVPGRPLQEPRSDDNTYNVPTTRVGLSGQLLSIDDVKTAPLPTADEKIPAMDLSNKAAAKIAQNSVKPPVQKHEKGIIYVGLVISVATIAAAI